MNSISVHTHTYIYSHIAKACAASGDAVRVRELHDDPSSRSCVFEWSSNDIFHKQSSGSLIMEATTLEATAPATTNTPYTENRLKYLASQKTEGNDPYPHKLSVPITILQ
ncbi:hypothetical protein MTR_4g127780 [Medicago truncatula]|uniref:Uncharacterized protein n=1 Tax=Medicago truncatula TaxID=3880 RepID=G7JUD7_MEDTR|nr:hypothetical protein MTR_4g127780 [Medicago truncatula]